MARDCQAGMQKHGGVGEQVGGLRAVKSLCWKEGQKSASVSHEVSPGQC